MHIQIYMHKYLQLHTSSLTEKYICVNARIHTYLETRIHKYTHIDTCMCVCVFYVQRDSY